MPDTLPPGADAVGRAIVLFTDRLLVDDNLSWAFDGIDLPRMQAHARAFVIAALGGPDLYVGRDMRSVHAYLKLTNQHFDAAVIHLVASLGAVGIDSSLLAALAARLEPLRRQIVRTL
jgi:hemoglobin